MKCKCGCDKEYWRGGFHCKTCGALTDKNLSMNGACFDCLKKEVVKLRKQIKEK
jgi:hypothetical protein